MIPPAPEDWRDLLPELLKVHGARLGIYHRGTGSCVQILWRDGVTREQGTLTSVHLSQLNDVTLAIYRELERLRRGEACDDGQLALFAEEWKPAGIELRAGEEAARVG